LAEGVVAADGMAFIDRLWEEWSPGYDAGHDLANAKRWLRDRRNLTAAIGYYRANEPGLDDAPPGAYAVEEAALDDFAPQPTLYLHGERDGCIDAGLLGDAPSHLSPGSEMRIIDEAGHFLHLEKPAEVNERILAWVA
jgi:pimeloyl-ACP methyl ester carboxylesterase